MHGCDRKRQPPFYGTKYITETDIQNQIITKSAIKQTTDKRHLAQFKFLTSNFGFD